MASACPVQYAPTILPLTILLTNHLQKCLVEQWQIVKQRQTTDAGLLESLKQIY